MGSGLAEQVTVTRATSAEKLILRHLMELYNYDFSEFDGSDVNEFGLYRYDYIDHYWTEASRHPYLVRVAGKLAGFVLIRLQTQDDGTPCTDMAEFFIMRKYRRHGVGERAARQLFDLYPGKWEVAEIPSNYPAQAFWRKVIGLHTNGRFVEITEDDGVVVQTFMGGAQE